MASEPIRAQRVCSAYVIECESEPIPPGTKCRAKLWRGEGPEPLPRRAWWLMGCAVAVALLVGVVLGRFLMP
jgi:hypothetical protein